MLKQTITIEVKYGSDFQRHSHSRMLKAFLDAQHDIMQQTHLGNSFTWTVDEK